MEKRKGLKGRAVEVHAFLRGCSNLERLTLNHTSALDAIIFQGA